LNQNLEPLEIIVVDDGSTDGGAEVVQGLSNSLIKLIRQPNQGESSARNAGVYAACGTYIAFLDADDFWYPNHIETLNKLLVDFPDAGLLSTMHEIRQDDKTIVPQLAFPMGFIGLVDNFFLRFANGLSLVNSTTACANRSLLLHLGGFPVGIRKGPDLITWTKIARSAKVVHASIITAIYNRDAVNRSVSLHENEVPGSLQYFAELLQNIGDEPERSSLLKLYCHISFYTCAGMCEIGDRETVKKILTVSRELGLSMLAAKISFLLLTPPSILTLARHWRRRNGN
jgi:glycosyltransferase involved in cell wall biosynthesis